MPAIYDVAKLGEPAPALHEEEEEEEEEKKTAGDNDDINKNLLALPERPIRGSLALWLPRAATVAGLGVTWLASRQQQQQPGANVAALALPFFGTGNPRERRVASYISWNLTSAFMIWTIEGWRGGNAGTVLAVPSVFGAAVQVFGVERVAPIYCLFSMHPELGDVAADDGESRRGVDPDVARAVLPATILGHVLPAALMSVLPMTATEVSRSYFTLQSVVCHLFYLSPITVSALTMAGSRAIKWFRAKFASNKDPVDDDGEEASGRGAGERKHACEPPALKTAYAVAFGLQALKHLSTATWVVRSYHSALSGLPGLSLVTGALERLLEGPGNAVVSTDPLMAYKLATAIFGLYTVWDLRRRGYTTSKEAVEVAITFYGLQDTCGAGAAYVGLWYWRESVLGKLRRRRARRASAMPGSAKGQG